MNELIELNKYPVKEVLPLLLKDKTTGGNIIFATDTYSKYGFYENDEITVGALFGFESCDIQPRVFKDQSEQTDRTRKKAEVFSPTWICNKMNSHCDSDWFGREDVFNTPDGQMWNTTAEKISFSDKKDWKKYIDSRRLEITCGEAPYIVSRYDATTGDPIETKNRIGFLDRKLRVVSENTETEEEWLEWATRAVQSVYGYEFQGDNLLIARINILISFCDYLKEKWGHEADKDVLKKIANIIAWNFWQMDGLTNSVPEFEKEEKFVQMALFDFGTEPEVSEGKTLCKIQNWRKESPLLFDDIQNKKRGKSMKFDYVIGNPPYQDDVQNKGDRPNPIYDKFIDSANIIGEKVCLIHPARFLFNAGQTPKQWNNKMLHDPHFKVLLYYADATIVFSNTDIKGGVAITYHDSNKLFGEIDVFTSYKELNTILRKILNMVEEKNRLSSIIASQGLYRFSNLFFLENPEAEALMGAGTGNKIVSSVIEKLPTVFLEESNDDDIYIRFLGRVKNQRVYRFIKRKYVVENEYLDKYNLFLPEANNSGRFGEVLTEPIVGYPLDGSSDTFLSGGTFESEEEPNNFSRYIKTKFFRALLGAKKVTQHCPPSVWSMIPIQDFTSSSDIDWSKSIAEIDGQLYRKYGLSDEEIEFIETHVKEMN